MLDAEAMTTAGILDRAYRMKSSAVYKTGWTVPKAIQAMKTILVNKDKAVLDLAKQVDQIYTFPSPKASSASP